MVEKTQLLGLLHGARLFGMIPFMRVLVAGLLCVCGGAAFADPPPLPLPWIKLSEIYYTPSQVKLYGTGDNLNRNCVDDTICNAVYVFKYPPPQNSYGPQTPNEPITVDLRPLGVGDDAKMALLTGELLITHSAACCEIADVHVTFAAAGSLIDCNQLIGQVAEQQFGGVRSNATFMVPLKDGQFQMCYWFGPSTTSAYGINLSVQMWGR